MTNTDRDPRQERVLVLAPAEREAQPIHDLLARASIEGELCADLPDLCHQIREGAGLAILAEEYLRQEHLHLLEEELRTAPPWSDLPLVVLAADHDAEEVARRPLTDLSLRANLIVLERPLRPWTLASTVRSALRARRRQYEMRDHLGQRQLAEEALRQSEVKFRTLADNVRASFGIVQGTRFVYANPYFAEVSGYSVDELLTMEFPQLVHPDYRAIMLERGLRRLRGEPVPNHYEFAMLTKAGQKRWVDFSVATLEYDGKNAFIGAGFDITDRKQASEALQASEENLRLALDAAQMGTWDWNIQSGQIVWSDRSKALFGVASEAAMTYDLFLQKIHPEDRLAIDQAAREALQNRTDYDVEIRVPWSDGTIHWVASKGRGYYDPAGRPVRMAGMALDITQRKRSDDDLRHSEEQRRLAMKAAHMGSWALDLTRQESTLDDQCRVIWAAPDWFTVSLDKVFDRIHPDDRQGAARHIENASDPRGSCTSEMEFRIVWPDGQVRWLRAAGHAIFAEHDGQRRAVRGVGVTLDITDQKRAEHQLKDLNEHLEHLVAQRTAMAEHRAEQLRALAAELTQAEQRERQRLARVLHDHLQQLLVGMKFTTSTVRARPGGVDLQHKMQQLDDLIDESLQTSRNLVVDLSPPILHKGSLRQVLLWLAGWVRDKHGLQVTVHADEQVDPRADEVRVLLFQATRELLLNTVKHAGVGEAVVELRRLDEEQIQVIVSDEGVGFDPLAIRKESSGGFGLLSIRERIESLGGRLTIRSAPSQGTRVTAAVPEGAAPPKTSQIPGRDGASADRGKATDAAPHPDGADIRILLADDHEVVRSGLAELLDKCPGFKVVGQAADGQAVVDLARQIHPDVILMDINMPQLDGIKATRQIVREQPHIRVIGLSMYTETGLSDKMRAAGAVGYVAKSSPPDMLIAAVRQSVTAE